MKALKFLADGSTGRFSGIAWPVPHGSEPGAWLEAGGTLELCRTGIHACLPEGLLGWLDDELWEIELGGRVEEVEDAVVGERGRLLRRVEAWDAGCAAEFVAAVSARATAGDLAGDLPALAAGLRPDDVPAAGAPPAASPGAIAANVAYVAASAVALASADPAAALADERAWQTAWLVERLGL